MSLHLEAKPGQIAETVLLPGDPLRARHVAETLLEDAECYNRVRGMFGYTGTYQGQRVSIQGSGMGMPSLGIYVNELLNEYGVKQLVRVGTCGAIQQKLKIGQVILAMSASGDSNVNQLFFGGKDFAATADFSLLMKAYQTAQDLGIPTLQGSIFSTDIFYDGDPHRWDKWTQHGVLAVEMETKMLYTLAARFGARALSVVTVSDNILTGEAASAEEREQSFTDMMHIALSLA
ncbi:MAG: purine-nucleoside phosphorylase [Saprospiraceae bacterium]|nr:purine-nucleoside phosphorylase [Saprospiraceae bacterium]